MATEKKAPKNPRLVHPDGSITSIKLNYFGLSEDDLHVWGPDDEEFTMSEDDTFLVDPPYPLGTTVVLHVLEKSSFKDKKAGFVKEKKTD